MYSASQIFTLFGLIVVYAGIIFTIYHEYRDWQYSGNYTPYLWALLALQMYSLWTVVRIRQEQNPQDPYARMYHHSINAPPRIA